MNYSPDLLTASIRMASALLVTLGVILFLLYLAKRFLYRGAVSSSHPVVTIIGRSPIGIKKNITLVEISDRVLVLGITRDSISLLATINEPQAVSQLKRERSQTASNPFAQQLQNLLAKKAPRPVNPDTRSNA